MVNQVFQTCVYTVGLLLEETKHSFGGVRFFEFNNQLSDTTSGRFCIILSSSILRNQVKMSQWRVSAKQTLLKDAENITILENNKVSRVSQDSLDILIYSRKI
ncbi:hypothetical protein [Nostoc sp.]|uniref:hypothetical protein n=1 Tax=Nostoc sp. TaxID=1180 RepID=UPI002FF7F675